jgi:hypothetical protein
MCHATIVSFPARTQAGIKFPHTMPENNPGASQIFGLMMGPNKRGDVRKQSNRVWLDLPRLGWIGGDSLRILTTDEHRWTRKKPKNENRREGDFDANYTN